VTTMKTRPSSPLALGIEIGGTKLQVGIGTTAGKLVPSAMVRRQVIRKEGAKGILRSLISMTDEVLAGKHIPLTNITRIGIAFGGVLDANRGVILQSYQIEGWKDFPLKTWAEKQWRKPVSLQNDASAAGLAESLHGNGRGYKRVFYITIGSGIGGGWIVDGKIDEGQGLGTAEIGHTWVVNPEGESPAELEHICSGWSIGNRARVAALQHKTLMTKLAADPDRIDAKIVYAAAEAGDVLANRILDETCEALGVAISNVIALLHPERVIIGGGVSLMGPLFWNRLKREVRKRTIPVFHANVDVVQAKLKEDVAVIGALCLG